MFRFKKIKLIIILLLFVVSLPLTTPDQVNAAKNKLKIGSLVALATKEGVEIKRWNNLFEKIINEKGGIKVKDKFYKIKITTYDVGYMDSAKTLSAVQKAIYQDKVKYLINNFADVYNLTINYTERNKVLYFGIGFGDDTVGTKNQYYFRPLGGFFTGATNLLIGKEFVKRGAKTGVVCTVDTEMGHMAGEQHRQGKTIAGLKMYPSVFYGADTVDFAPVATKIKSLNPDVVDFCVAWGDQIVNLVAALKDSGWKGFIYPGQAVSPATFNNIIKRVGSYFDNTIMLYGDPRYIPIIANNPEMANLIKRYQQEYGEFNTEGCIWLTGWFYLMDAIKNTNNVNTTVLKDYLAKGQTPPITLSGYPQLFARPDIGQYRTTDGAAESGYGIVKNKKLVYLGMLTSQDQYLSALKINKLEDVYRKYWKKYGEPKFIKQKSALKISDFR